MAATSRATAHLVRWRSALLRTAARGRGRLPCALAAQLLGTLASLLAPGTTRAVELPQDRADLMYHYYDGGGTKASGPALLVRKGLTERMSLAGTYYVDMVSNASIDVVTTASPYKERRNEENLTLDYLYRDSLITLSGTNSREPDYTARTVDLDVAQDVWGGTSTINLGYTRAWDKVGKKGEGFIDVASHWRYRLGLTQIVTPRWLAGLNFEAVSDEGLLGSPYRAARAFGTTVPENNPRTRTSRAVELRVAGDLGSRDALHLSYRYSWDTWAIKAHTADVSYARYFGERWLGDAYVRFYRQAAALFYSDNATTQTTYLSRNRQLATYRQYGLGTKVSYTAKVVPGKYTIKFNGVLERARFNFSDFTDVRTGAKYSYDATIAQVFVSAAF